MSFRPLVWDGRRLALGPSRLERVSVAVAGVPLGGEALVPGDVVACHWGWACQRLTPRQHRWLQMETRVQLDLVNRAPVPPPALVLS